MTALIIAARGGHVDVAGLLIDAGADVNHSDYTGRTVLEWAGHGRSQRLVKLLEEAGARF
jgi:ankyrin repeat protein